MRRPRIQYPGAEYHVVARANRQEFILKEPRVKELLLQVLKEARRRFNFSIRNFCIMSNHVHLMVRPGKRENLSRIMQWILSVFAIRYNRLLGLHGHVWYDRFRSRVIENYRQLLATFVYVSENPVRAGIVDRPIAYRYSGVTYIRDGDYRIVDKPSGVFRLLCYRWQMA